MELFMLCDDIIFEIFSYVNNIKDINNFIYTSSVSHKVKNYITIINNDIDDYNILYKYPNLKYANGCITIHNQNILTKELLPCFNNIQHISIDFPIDIFYSCLYWYITKYLSTKHMIQYMEFTAYNESGDNYNVKRIEIENNKLFIWEDQDFLHYPDDIIPKKNFINTLMSQISINGIISKSYDKNFILLLLEQKVKSIRLDHLYPMDRYVTCDTFKHLCADALSSIEEFDIMVLFKKDITYMSSFTDEVMNIMLDKKIINYNMKKLMLPISSNNLRVCELVFPNIEEIFIIKDNDEDMICWLNSLILPKRSKTLLYTEYKNIINNITYNNINIKSVRVKFVNIWD
ncbi:Hypothetical protein ORPV_1070 [Orpheovirus IHUMI-LCC2]|uniref:Uncharacterized protein n=1 Tax=Orpheovirus IHUMI-LCC2 TaxID=2023057 RepID=A0A2I2L612_9VIRU|nr:Hypothetical protein ORPV_1070 [Orpheovirus IHUMI-LCC2]SNW62974.1 Hypothetical protein ORPV_1070 [Orpheovirus IHUMI-LCC2]